MVQEKQESNVVFIGNKNFMNYVTATSMQITNDGKDEVIVKARGKFITRAVDVVEVIRKKFLQGKVFIPEDGIKIDSEPMLDKNEGKEKNKGNEKKDKKEHNISSIEITLKKK